MPARYLLRQLLTSLFASIIPTLKEESKLIGSPLIMKNVKKRLIRWLITLASEQNVREVLHADGAASPDINDLEDRSIFIVGCARSGTTILWKALNCSDDIFLLSETNPYRNGWKANFVDTYNYKHERLGNQKQKSLYLPRD